MLKMLLEPEENRKTSSTETVQIKITGMVEKACNVKIEK